MSDPFQNLQEKTGHTMPEWCDVLVLTGLEKHGDLMAYLKREYGVSHGFANGIALQFRTRGTEMTEEDLVAAQYSGAKAALLPLYERLVAVTSGFGPDVEVAPKKTGVSLRRAKQFALIEAPSAKRLQVQLQLRDFPTTDRLLASNAMCSHKIDVTSVDDIDDELVAWLREAYERN